MFFSASDAYAFVGYPVFAPAPPAPSSPLTDAEFGIVQRAIGGYIEVLRESGLKLHVRRDFDGYVAVRHAHGDHHLNQAFDPGHARIGSRDFWLLIEDARAAAVATVCMRIFEVENFYSVIQSQSLWFGLKPRLVDPDFVVSCAIPAFGGRVGHGGGLWIHPDRRGQHGLAFLLPRLLRALALRNSDIDHDTGMLLNTADPQRAAAVARRAAAAARIYGFARHAPMVQGWFPPEARTAAVHLCHMDRREAIDSLVELSALAAA
jgi:hypothetical protein